MALGVRHLVVSARVVEAESAVGVDLGQTDHAGSPEVGARLAHLIGGHRVVTGFTGGVGDRQRRDDGVVAEAIPVEKGDALDAGPLPGELVKERLPNGLR